MIMKKIVLAAALVTAISGCATEDDSFDPVLDETSQTSEGEQGDGSGQDALVDRLPPSEEERAPQGGCTSAQQTAATNHMHNNHPGATMTGCTYNASTGYIVYTFSCANMYGGYYFLCLYGW